MALPIARPVAAQLMQAVDWFKRPSFQEEFYDQGEFYYFP
jgi:hypothetical protein